MNQNRKIIFLKPVAVTPAILSRLERRGLIRTLKPTAKVLRYRDKRGTVDTIYSSAPRFGAHKLICIRLHDLNRIKLTSHGDNEEFIIIDGDSRAFKPLYLVMGLHKHAVLEKKAKNAALTERDFILLCMKYNDCRTSIFVMLKGTPHCEVSAPGRGNPPIFFVTEPSRLRINRLKLDGYRLAVKS